MVLLSELAYLYGLIDEDVCHFSGSGKSFVREDVPEPSRGTEFKRFDKYRQCNSPQDHHLERLCRVQKQQLFKSNMTRAKTCFCVMLLLIDLTVLIVFFVFSTQFHFDICFNVDSSSF